MSDDLGDHPGTPAHRALSEVGESLVRVRVKDPKAHRLNLETPLYSIRIPDSKEDLDCGLCDRRFTAVGPTGHLEDEPICDLCMLEHHVQLGMVLALIAVTRSYGSGWPQDELEESHARLELMAFARIYESKASHFAPARPVDPNWLWPDGVDLDPNIS